MADVVEAQVESPLRTSHGFPGHLSMAEHKNGGKLVALATTASAITLDIVYVREPKVNNIILPHNLAGGEYHDGKLGLHQTQPSIVERLSQ